MEQDRDKSTEWRTEKGISWKRSLHEPTLDPTKPKLLGSMSPASILILWIQELEDIDPRIQELEYINPRIQELEYINPRIQELEYINPRIQKLEYIDPRIQKQEYIDPRIQELEYINS